MGMGLFMAVGRGSENSPRMIVMRSGKAGEKDALGRHPRDRRQGRLLRLGRHLDQAIRPDGRDEDGQDRRVHGHRRRGHRRAARAGAPLLVLAPAVENMPGPHSTRPGDVVKALNGKWVDITNTDAEGRLILADALTYAERLGATHLVDVATLTGAVARALGELMSGAFGTPQPFMDEVFAAGAKAGERYWQLPPHRGVPGRHGQLVRRHRQLLGNNEGGLVKSAMFIQEFVTKPWVHLDIAGTAYYRKVPPYAARGSTGVAHATLVELALAGAKA